MQQALPPFDAIPFLVERELDGVVHRKRVGLREGFDGSETAGVGSPGCVVEDVFRVPLGGHRRLRQHHVGRDVVVRQVPLRRIEDLDQIVERMEASPRGGRGVAGYRTGPIEPGRADRRPAGPEIPNVAIGVPEHEVLREHAQRPERVLRLEDVGGQVEAIDLFIECRCRQGIHVGGADHVGFVPDPGNDWREDPVVAGVLDRPGNRLAVFDGEGLTARLHRQPLAVILIAPLVGWIDVDLVAVGDVRAAGGLAPPERPVVGEQQQGAEGIARRFERTRVDPVFVEERSIDLAVRIAQYDRRARGGSPGSEDPFIGCYRRLRSGKSSAGVRELEPATAAVVEPDAGLIRRPEQGPGQRHRVAGPELRSP